MELHVTFTSNDFTEKYTTSNNESNFYHEIGIRLVEIDVPNNIEVLVDEYPGDKISYEVTERGTFTKNGVPQSSMYVIEIEDTINDKLEFNNDYKRVFLTCINPESNNYKYYEILPTEEPFFIVKYGRIEESIMTYNSKARSPKDPYDSRLYWIRYYEKISKGYVDNTDIYVGSMKNPTLRRQKASNKKYSDDISTMLYEKLLSYSKQIVQDNLVFTHITSKQLQLCNEIYLELCATKTVKQFNEILLRLFAICPRKMTNVSSHLAHSSEDKKRILDFENSLNSSMNVVFNSASVPTVSLTNPFEEMDIELYPATPDQIQHVYDHLYDELKPQVKNIYRVVPNKQRQIFNTYLKTNNITEVKEFWHGSKNENWLSIIQNSLLLYPDAEITGKMFGDGIYFASNIYKSLNYTSLEGSYWTNGKSKTGFMGLFATAYGDPLFVKYSNHFSESDLLARKKNCVHAQAGPSLMHDEIIFYNEAAVLLNYIVEFER